MARVRYLFICLYDLNSDPLNSVRGGWSHLSPPPHPHLTTPLRSIHAVVGAKCISRKYCFIRWWRWMQLDVEIPSKTNWNLCTSGSDKGQRYLDGTSGSAINSWVRIFSNSSHQIEDLTNLVVSKVVISSDYMVFYMNNGLSVRLHPNISQIFWPIWVETKLQHMGGVNRDVTVRPLSMVWCMCNFFDQIFFHLQSNALLRIPFELAILWTYFDLKKSSGVGKECFQLGSSKSSWGQPKPDKIWSGESSKRW